MIKPDPIYCPSCGAMVISDSRNLTNYVMQDDIKCGCGTIVVYKTQVTY